MRILHVVPAFGLGGMEKIICSIVNNCSEQYDHTILSLNNNRTAEQWITRSHIDCVRFNRPPGNLMFFKALYKALEAINPDLLMTYNWGAIDAIWLGKLAGVRTIIHNEHGFNVDEAHRTHWKRDVIRRIVYRLASRIIVVSHEQKTLMRDHYHIQEQQVVFIPNGVNPDLYAPDPRERRRVRQQLGLKATDLVVGFSGRLDPVKNFDRILSVVECCVKQNRHFRLMIIGDGPEKSRIETISRQRHVEDQVLLIGQKDNVLPYLRALDVFLLTSFREQMPLSLLEAMSVGIPVIASRVGEIPHIVDDGVDGFTIMADETSEDIAGRLLTLTDTERRTHMGVLARNKIMASFQEDTMIRRYKEVIEESLL